MGGMDCRNSGGQIVWLVGASTSTSFETAEPMGFLVSCVDGICSLDVLSCGVREVFLPRQ